LNVKIPAFSQVAVPIIGAVLDTAAKEIDILAPSTLQSSAIYKERRFIK